VPLFARIGESNTSVWRLRAGFHIADGLGMAATARKGVTGMGVGRTHLLGHERLVKAVTACCFHFVGGRAFQRMPVHHGWTTSGLFRVCPW